MHRTNLAQADRACFDAMSALNAEVDQAAMTAGLDLVTLELLRVRVSQINGCASCLRMHTEQCLERGESPVKLGLVAAWRECQYFSPTEQAAFTIAESITTIAAGPLLDEQYEEVAAVLTEEQLSALSWAAVTINAWNRVALTSKWPVLP